MLSFRPDPSLSPLPMESLQNQSEKTGYQDDRQLLLVYPFVGCKRHFPCRRKTVYPLAT